MADFNGKEGHWVTTKSGKHIFISEDLVGKRDREINEQEEYTKKLNEEHDKDAPTKNYSDVESRTTEVSPEALAQLNGQVNFRGGYFQSALSWNINKALRDSYDQGISVGDALSKSSFVSDDMKESMLKTIETMDRNMKPLNADVESTRLVDHNYFKRITQGLGLSEDTLKGLYEDVIMGTVKDGDALKQLKEALTGMKICENGYISTCLDPNLTNLISTIKNGKHVKIELSISKGTKAMFSPTKLEDELVVDRHASYKITDVGVRDGDLIIKAKI